MSARRRSRSLRSAVTLAAFIASTGGRLRSALTGMAVPLVAIATAACITVIQPPSDSTTGAASGTLSFGDAVAVAAATIGESGGAITVGDSGGSLVGLALQVPSGAYGTARDFAVSYRPITGHSYDERINPISPLITVENGGGYADDIITLKVPVEVPQGHFAMGFFYDRDTGALEGMPLVAEEASSVTVATRHFSDFFISSVLQSVLLNITVDSGFRPGVDDWQFQNKGSYIAPRGLCAGQSIAAMWYYNERKDEQRLYGRYDNYLSEEEKTPDLWEDDNLAYRLASTVHADAWSGVEAKILRSVRSVADDLHMLAFAYAFHVTGTPQFVSLGREGGGHAVIGYKIEKGSLWIADPNFPGVKSAERQIEFRDGKFQPYTSAEYVGGPGRVYTKIGFMATTALVEWDAVGARFAEMENGAVGDEYFPAYTMLGQGPGAAAVPLVDGVAFPDDQLAVPIPDLGWTVKVFRAGQELPKVDGWVTLEPGENKLGILVQLDDRYVDFYRVTVIYNEVTIEPDPITGNAGDDLSMTATMPADVPDARYMWDYGDGTPMENLTQRAMHVFAEEGEYPVTLMVYDAKDRVVGRGEATAKIGAGGATPTTSPEAGTGQWVLKYTDINVEKYETQFGYPGLTCNGGTTATSTESGATTTQSGTCQVTGALVANGTSQHSWSRPPDRLTPGQEVTGTLTASQSGLCSWQGWENTEELCRGWTYTEQIVLLADSLRGEPWLESDIVYQGYDSTGVTEDANARDRPTSSFAWTVPDNAGGNKSLVVKFTAGQSNAQHVSTIFWYEWRGP